MADQDDQDAPVGGLPSVAAAQGRTERLNALRAHMAARLEVAPDQYAAAIGRLVKDLDTELAALPSVEEVSHADEVAARRAARRGRASGAARPG